MASLDPEKQAAVCPITGARAGSAVPPPAAVEESVDENEQRRRIVQRRKLDDPLYYGEYLKIPTVPKSAEAGKPAHDEHLFIIIHQVYELWFKQILHEMDSIITIFKEPYVPESSIGLAVERLTRVVEIQKILIQQLDVLETMSPMNFLDFRDFLFPASGFQSVQFRLIENKLGLRVEQRMNYGARGYCSYLKEQDAEEVHAAETQSSLFDLVEQWLERTPPLAAGTAFDFWKHYRTAVHAMFDEDERSINASSSLPKEAKTAQVDELAAQREHFETLFDRSKHDALVARGDRRMSHAATQAALLIWLYRSEPLLQQPYRMLSLLLDMDENLVRWRYRHAQMVHRMLGVKIGTGGSSGYSYLRATANKHKIFGDLFNLSTFLIPRYCLSPLPSAVQRMLRFKIEPNASGAVSPALDALPEAAAGVQVPTIPEAAAAAASETAPAELAK